MKVYLSNLNESWVVDRFKNDWLLNNSNISTRSITKSDIIWIIAPWTWKKISKRQLKKKKVVCSIYHINFSKFDDDDKIEFYERDKFVDIYHVISNKTAEQVRTLTNKKIVSIPFWVDSDIWFEIKDKEGLRKKYGFSNNDYIVGSFQRDTEGSDLISPKLIKGPDILFKILQKISKKNPNLTVLLSGKRRNYLINKFNENNINFKYLEMVNLEELNELYNIIDLYIVSSRIEGGPQAIMEASIIKTPIVSTDVGIASEVLSKESIFSDESNFSQASPNIEISYENAKKFTIPQGMRLYIEMFEKLHES